jgi:hypothetical protein
MYIRLYSSSAGELRVYVKPVDKEMYELEPRFEVAGNQGNVWRKGIITIEILEKPFQVCLQVKLTMAMTTGRPRGSSKCPSG